MKQIIEIPEKCTDKLFTGHTQYYNFWHNKMEKKKKIASEPFSRMNI